ncbi:hypothetical protein AMK59_6620 [Oryctes borbonicus]|uniref:Large ribosomal subunit protein mL42 n=1 Tax=Oryctes borbonicus TaxID=1629725 RepID=A0A0T6AY84_9SCAR|nr:hypothetical protein AMK59_6620 [Oryctes borbonicus]
MALKLRLLQNSLTRCYSSRARIALTDNESTYVVWHKRQDFPYECTKPLPETSSTKEEHTVLKTSFTPQLQQVFNKKSPEIARQELMNITTKPLPETSSTKEEHTVLKTSFTPQLQEVFNKKSPEIARQELMNITYTTKHRWFPRARDKKAKKTPMDREYL